MVSQQPSVPGLLQLSIMTTYVVPLVFGNQMPSLYTCCLALTAFGEDSQMSASVKRSLSWSALQLWSSPRPIGHSS